jgi:tRNA 2-selenouridine synthase
MIPGLSAEEFLHEARHVPVIDVRAPAEFFRGHIPGACNIPLFDDLERAEVGIMYHKAGREEAIKKGLEIVGPKMRAYVDEALNLAIDHQLLVYCWRGGMRSESMAWLLSTAGIRVSVLENGYKGYRRHIRASFERNQPVIIIGGMTGSGKTELLNKMADFGFQIVDLERLANHKGSVFGNLGLPEQPTNEQFENDLGKVWLELDPAKPVFIEDESINIGRDSIPKSLYLKMQKAPAFYVDMPSECRVERLFSEYAHFAPDVLNQLIGKITRRLGGANAKAAVQAIEEGHLRDAIRISLIYYDKAYGFGAGKRERKKIIYLKTDNENVAGLIDRVIKAMPEMTMADE